MIACRSLSLFAIAMTMVAASPLVSAQSNPLQGTWASTLQSRDLNGDAVADAYYDTVLGVTWMADANLAATTGVVPGGSDPFYSPAGGMSYDTAVPWLSGLNYHGTTGWRLPNATFTASAANDQGCGLFFMFPPAGCNYRPDTSTNELAHLFYVTLGNTGSPDIGSGLSNIGAFNNLAGPDSSMLYLTGAPVVEGGWISSFSFSVQQGVAVVNPETAGPAFVWAVHDGDVGVSPIPEPETYVLMLVGLGALSWVAKRRRRPDDFGGRPQALGLG